MLRRLVLALAVALACSSPVLAQWQVPSGAIPVGRGPGASGFNTVAGSGGAGSKCIVDTNPPTFVPCATDSTPEVWYATGQSNLDVFRPIAWAPPSNAHIWNNSHGTCITTGNAWNALDNTTVNPAVAFVADRARQYPNKQIYLINVAYQSQAIAQWLPGAVDNCPAPATLQDMYTKGKNNVVAGLANLGVTKLTGILFWQGETDGINGSTTWKSDFETLVTRFKGETFYPSNANNIPNWIIFGIAGRIQSTTFATADAFNQTYILPAVNNDPFYRMFVNTAAFPASFWDTTVIPGHMNAVGYYEAGIMASRALYENVPDGYIFFASPTPALNGSPSGLCPQNAFSCLNNNIVIPSAPPLANTMAHWIQRDGQLNTFTMDSYGTGVLNTILGRMAGTTALAPSATPGGNITFQLGGQGYDATGFSTGFNTHSRLKFFTINTQSSTDHSGAAVIGTTPAGSTTTADTSWFTQSGGFHNGASYVDVPTGVIDATTGYRINNAAPIGHVPRGNGTNYIDGQVAPGDMSGLGIGVATALGTAVNTAGGFMTQPLATLTYGTHLSASAGASSYNGSVASTIATDATSANTASTIVARDSSGNFSAGTVTAAVTGHASSDCALTGCTMTGNTTYSPDTGGIVGATSGNCASAGNVGECVTATAGVTAITSATQTNIITQSLTAGIWLVTCQITYNFTNATTVLQSMATSVSTTSATLGSDLNSFNFGANSTITPDNGGVSGFTQASPSTIVKLSGTNNVYCVGYLTYLVSTAQVASARFNAVRIH